MQSLVRGGNESFVHLGDVKFSKALSIDVNKLILSGKIADPLESHSRQTAIKLFSDELTVQENVSVYADNIFMYANSTLVIRKNAVIRSTKVSECTVDNTGNTDLYECMPPEFDG